MRYVLVLRVLIPVFNNFARCGCDSISAAMMYVPSRAEIQDAQLMSEMWLWTPKVWRGLHISAAASFLDFTGVEGIFFPPIE